VLISLYAALGFFALLAVLLVYRYDLYNREPWYMLLLAIALGAVTMRVVAVVETVALGIAESPVGLAAVAALVEELARLAVVGAVAVAFPRQFDDPMDGIVYGSIVGLGMALEESVAQLGGLGEPGLLALPVELVRLLGHLVMGGMGGFGVGVARVGLTFWPRALGRSFAAAVLLHFLWDWIALSSPEGASLSPALTVAGVAVMSAGILFYGTLVELGSRLSRERFDPRAETSLWGWPFRGRRR
jgi:RsiW-degrading membrane proteinase PrsW (M82 family)